MDKETIEDFSKYRIEKAKETLKTAEFILEEGNDYASANNRAYYAIFYAIRAVLALEQIDFKRHKDVVAYFNKMYVATGKFPKDLGRMIAKLQQLREKSDYDDFFVASIAKAEQQIMTAEKVITEVDYFIRNNDSKSK